MFNSKWEEKQGSNLPSQATRMRAFPGTHVGNMALQSPPGFSDKCVPASSSRSRNLTNMASSVSTPACSIPQRLNMCDGNSLINGQGNSSAVFTNGQKSVDAVGIRHNQFHHPNHLSGTRPIFSENPFGNGIEKMSNASYNVVSQLQPSVSVKMMPAAETWKQTDNVLSQTEAQRSADSTLQELIRILSTTHGSSLKMPLEVGSSEYLRLVEILKQSSFQHNKLPDRLDSRGYSQGEYSGTSMQHSSYPRADGTNNPPNAEIGSLGYSVSSEQSINGCHGEENIKVKEMTVTPTMEKPKLSLTEDESSNHVDNEERMVENGQKDDNSLDSPTPKMDEKRFPSEKGACILAERLWDGSLQLSSSVTLSAVAFFKSGEKLLGSIWPEHVEVKGKVRLEAFEKYVQDLPRSRNRGLMVISLCWKEGSSETGVNGMKEVAKGYKKSSRVGFAHLSSGIDLYICPRTDAIITILAKYGFFKGMAVIDDKPDSMIGCVVWRKNRSSNPSDSKTSSNVTQSHNSPSGASIKQDPEKEFSPIREAPESAQRIQPVDHKEETSFNSGPLQNPVSFDNMVKKRPFEDDDLPEFDFGTSQPRKPTIPQNRGLIPVHPLSQPKASLYPVLEAKKAVLKNENDGSFERSSKRTKLFDEDDDDMPEWCPPVLHNKAPPQITNFNKLPPFPPSRPPPPVPPPPPADSRSVFSYQQFRPPMRAPPMPPLRHPAPSVGLNLNANHGPRLSFLPSGGRGPRP